MAPEESDGGSGLSFCLICDSDQNNDSEFNCEFVERSSSSSFPLPSWPASPPETLDKALDAYFILKHVLELPSGKLEDFLRRSPNPEKWVKICGDCYMNFVIKCKGLFLELVEVQSKFADARKELIGAVKKSVRVNDQSDNVNARGTDQQLTLDVTKETRRFVRNVTHCGPSAKIPAATTTTVIDEMVQQVATASGSRRVTDAESHIKQEYVSDEEEEEELAAHVSEMADNNDMCGEVNEEGKHSYAGPSQVSNEAMDATVDEDEKEGEEEDEDHCSAGDEDWSGGDLSESSDETDGDSDGVGDDDARNMPVKPKTAKNPGGTDPTPAKNSHSRKPLPENVELMKGIKFKCDICSLNLPTAKALGRHMSQKHGKNMPTIPCPICEKPVRCEYFRNHVTNVHATERLQCPKCPQTFKKGSGLRYHMRADHRSPDQDIPIYSCTFPGCQRSYIEKSQLEYHTRYHGPPTLHCSICGKGYHSNRDLRRHELQHETKITRPFMCDQCPARYSSREGLQDHTKQRHPTSDGGNNLEESTPHPCPTCGKTYRTSRLLTRHINFLHVKKHPVTCEICGKVVASHSLKSHIKLAHENPVQFHCPKTGCRRRFRTEEFLKRHAKTHDERTEWKCDHCDKLFKNGRSLARHLRRVRPTDNPVPGTFVCGECGRACKNAGSFKLHMKMHKKDV